MSYLPDLRTALVRAAERQRAAAGTGQPTPERSEGRWRRRGAWASPGGFATALAGLGALAVLVLAIALGGHGRNQTGAGNGARPRPGAPASRTAVDGIAVLTLNQFVPPPGAVKSGLVPGTPSDLWTPGEYLAVPHRVDVYRVWRLPGNPDSVMRFLQAHAPVGSRLGSGSSSGSGSGASGSHPVTTEATSVFDYPVTARTSIVRELAVRVVSLPGGGSALRADGEAGAVLPRSPEETIPDGADTVRATTSKPNGAGRLRQRSLVVKSAGRVARLVALLNALPRAQTGARCSPTKDSGVRLRLALYSGAGATPLALAVYNPFCNRVSLTIAGRPQPDLAVGYPDPLAQLPQLQELGSFGLRLR